MLDHKCISNLFWLNLHCCLYLQYLLKHTHIYIQPLPSLDQRVASGITSLPHHFHKLFIVDIHPVNSVEVMIKSMQMELVSRKNILTLSLSTSSSTCLMLASSPIPYSAMACSSSSLVMYLQLLCMLSRVNHTKPFLFY